MKMMHIGLGRVREYIRQRFWDWGNLFYQEPAVLDGDRLMGGWFTIWSCSLYQRLGKAYEWVDDEMCSFVREFWANGQWVPWSIFVKLSHGGFLRRL